MVSRTFSEVESRRKIVASKGALRKTGWSSQYDGTWGATFRYSLDGPGRNFVQQNLGMVSENERSFNPRGDR
jgi:hypothetical protein